MPSYLACGVHSVHHVKSALTAIPKKEIGVTVTVLCPIYIYITFPQGPLGYGRLSGCVASLKRRLRAVEETAIPCSETPQEEVRTQPDCRYWVVEGDLQQYRYPVPFDGFPTSFAAP